MEPEFGEVKEKPYKSKVLYLRYTGAMKAEVLKGLDRLVHGGIKTDKLKSFINGSIKAKKLEGFVIGRARLERLKHWAAWVTTVLLLWAITVQLKALGETLLLRISQSSFPPESTYIVTNVMHACMPLFKFLIVFFCSSVKLNRIFNFRL